MRKFILFLFFVFCSVSSYATSSFHGTYMPDAKKWHVGLESTVVVDRKLESDFGKFRTTMYLVDFSYSFTDWFCADWSLGWGSAKLNPYNHEEIDYASAFAGKYGFRIKLIDNEGEPFKLVTGFQHYCVHPRGELINGVKRRVILDDWQGSVVGSYDITDKFSPYLGVAFSEGDVIEWYGDYRKRRQSENSDAWGMILGFNYFLDDNWSINIEGRMFDGKVVTCGVNYAL